MTISEKWRLYDLFCEITGQVPSHYDTLKNFMRFYKEVYNMYYYTDAEELDALRKENAKLKANITNLVTKLDNLEAKYKKGASKNGTNKKQD